MKDKENEITKLKEKLENYKSLLENTKDDSIKETLSADIADLEKRIAIIEGKVEIPERHLVNVRAWEAKYGKVKPLAFIEGTDIKFIFLRKFGRQELSAAETLATDEKGELNLDTKAEKLMTDSYLGGDIKLEDILKDIEYFLPVANKVLYELVEQKKTIWINS